jgi:uncharacterized protein (TIGR03032 family)
VAETDGRFPVFVTATPGTAAGFLTESLRLDTGLAVAFVPAAAREETAGSLSALARTVPEARFVFLAAEEGDAAPTELQALSSERWCRAERGRLLADPSRELQKLCTCLGIDYDQALLGPIEAARRAMPTESGEAAPSPFASVSTSTFSTALEQTASSLLISTYQTNRLVCARVADGSLNTHFRAYDKPMGIAVGPGRIALGTRTEVWDLRDMPEAAPKLEPVGSHDACYLPRNRHVTGDIAVHDLAFAGGELWLVATGFSCLATLDETHSFVPRWRPPFISSLAPEDRCHLNGLAVYGDQIAHVTALGTGDDPGSWRATKAGGGVLIDVASSEIAIAGLSMPHSPRWYRDRLWLLESGKGTLCVADLDAGTTELVAELPGFTRGLTFADGIAFVGLSQIRESATFGELPVTRRLRERQSGVWMVDVQAGETVGFLRFEDLVQEIFDVAIIPGRRFPEIAEPSSLTTARSYLLP